MGDYQKNYDVFSSFFKDRFFPLIHYLRLYLIGWDCFEILNRYQNLWTTLYICWGLSTRLCKFFSFKLHSYRTGLKKNVQWPLTRFLPHFYVKLPAFDLSSLNVRQLVIDWMKTNSTVPLPKIVFKMPCVTKFKLPLRVYCFRTNLTAYLIPSPTYKKKELQLCY